MGEVRMLVALLMWGATVPALADLSGTASDAITLEDGSVVRGQVAEGARFGGVTVLVRRDWARRNAPAWLSRWERQELPLILRGRRERKERLIAWRRDRILNSIPSGDRMTSWINAEVARLSTLKPGRTVLTLATFPRSETRGIDQQMVETGRLLRLGWLAGLNDVETLPLDELTVALEPQTRIRPDDPGRVDALLPLYPEGEERWRARRAATEVVFDPSLRYVRFRQLTLPETGPNSDATPQTTSELIDSPAGRAAFAAIQGVSPFDAIDELLDDIAGRGYVGAIISRVELGIDSDQVEAESTFWVCQRGGRWTSLFTRRAVVASGASSLADRTPALEGSPIKTTLQVLETVASAPSSPEVSQLRQRLGATAELALGKARAALDQELAPLVLSVTR